MYDLLLILHFLGLALGVGTSFAMLTLGLASQDLQGEERGKFFRRVAVLGKNGSIGFTLLILSGLGMLFDKGVSTVFAWGGGAFHAKLALVVVLAGCLGYSQVLAKRMRNGDQAAMAALPKLGRVMLLLGVGTVTAAVLAFH
jgi:uncharacterized membrane protein